MHAVFAAGRIRRGAQVHHLAFVGQRHERVTKPFGNEHRAPVLIVEPDGLARLWRNIRNYFRLWPFSY